MENASLGDAIVSGAGGMDIAAEYTGRINTRIALDFWSDACATLRGFLGEHICVIDRDISSIDNPLSLWQDASGEVSPPDLVFGGPPCQSFSQAGKQKGFQDSRGGIIFEFLRFIVVLVDLENHKLIGLVPARTQTEIEKVMQQWGEKVLAQIKEVSIDMTGNYKSLIRKICPKAEVTVDRFHAIKMIHQELNQARIDQKKTAEELNVKARANLFGS